MSKKKSTPYATAVDEIFLLSDGSPTTGSITNTDRILDIVRTWNTGARVRINAIYIGDDVTDEDAFEAVAHWSNADAQDTPWFMADPDDEDAEPVEGLVG